MSFRSPRSISRYRRYTPAVFGVSAAVVLSCSEFVQPAAKAGGGVNLVPVFSTVAMAAGPALASAGLTVDHIHIVLHDDADTTKVLLDTTIAVLPGVDSLAVDLNVADNPGSTVDAGLQFLSGSTTPPTVLFTGTAKVTTHAVGSTVKATAGDTVHVNYVGPGATATAVTIAPASGSVPAFQSDTLTAIATDNTKASVSTPIVWSVDDTSLATISILSVANNVSTAVLKPTGKRGTVTITAAGLNGVSGTAKLLLVTGAATIVADTTSLNQTGTVGATLGKPILVLVQSQDGGVVKGQTVTFSSTGNGSITASAVTDSTGHAKATAKLGTVAGVYTYTATAGTASVTVNAGASAGSAKTIVKLSGDANAGTNCKAATAGTAGCDTVTNRLSVPFVVQVQDSAGNVVPGATVTWTRTTGTGSLRCTPTPCTSTTTTTTLDGDAANLYILGSTLNATDNISASIANGANVTFSATTLGVAAAARAATQLVIFGDTVVVVSNGTLPTDFPYVAVQDANNTGVSGFSITVVISSAPAAFSNNPCPTSKPCTFTTDSYGVMFVPSNVASNGAGITKIPGNYTIVVSSPNLTPNKPGAKKGDPFTFYITVQ